MTHTRIFPNIDSIDCLHLEINDLSHASFDFDTRNYCSFAMTYHTFVGWTFRLPSYHLGQLGLMFHASFYSQHMPIVVYNFPKKSIGLFPQGVKTSLPMLLFFYEKGRMCTSVPLWKLRIFHPSAFHSIPSPFTFLVLPCRQAARLVPSPLVLTIPCCNPMD